MQDVFVNFAQTAETIHMNGNLKRFLLTCVANRVRNQKRDQKRHETDSIDNLDCGVSDLNRPEEWAILSEELELLRDAMA